MKILVLTLYGKLGASSRVRFHLYEKEIIKAGHELCFSPLISDSALFRRYKFGRYSFFDLLHSYLRRILILLKRKNFDLIWIEKEAFPWCPVFLEHILLSGVPWILDYDDATFHRYDLHSSEFVRGLYGSKISSLMRRSSLVICGNSYLANYALNSGAINVDIIPSSVDLAGFLNDDGLSCREPHELPVIVWIGSPTTSHYLNLVAESLRQLSARIPFVLRLIGADSIEIPGVNVERLCWSSADEMQFLKTSDIGIMPLYDSPWELGKCAFKLIQYMAACLPCVASGVGANTDVIVNGETGFIINSDESWVTALELLLRDDSLRKKMGKAGRHRVLQNYSLEVNAPKLLMLLGFYAGNTS